MHLSKRVDTECVGYRTPWSTSTLMIASQRCSCSCFRPRSYRLLAFRDIRSIMMSVLSLASLSLMSHRSGLFTLWEAIQYMRCANLACDIRVHRLPQEATIFQKVEEIFYHTATSEDAYILEQSTKLNFNKVVPSMFPDNVKLPVSKRYLYSTIELIRSEICFNTPKGAREQSRCHVPKTHAVIVPRT